MGAHRQRFLHDLSTLVTFLAGEARVHSNHLMSSVLSFGREDIEKRAPTGVHDAFGEMVILYHVTDRQVFNDYALIALGIRLSHFEMVISTLTLDLQMGFRNVPGSLATAMTALLSSAKGPLLAPQGLLRGAIEPRVLNRLSKRVRQEGLEPHVKANIRMLAHGGQMLVLWSRLADDEGVPMSIRTQNQMHGLRRALYRTMQLDLERFPKLSRHDQMFLVLVHRDIFAILPELDGVPLVAFLKAREAHFHSQRFSGKKTVERLGETISKHLYCRGWHVYTATTLKLCRQIVLCREGALLLIVLFGDLKHLVIDEARLTQAVHEQCMLVLVGEKAILKRFHTASYSG